MDLKAFIPALAHVVAGSHRMLVFKGGAYLIKCYLGYPRFSEDIDFT